MKIYELVIPVWNAAVPADWTIQTIGESEDFVPCAGKHIVLRAGDKIRGNPEDPLIVGMLKQEFIKETEA